MNILGQPAHIHLRKQRAGPILAEIHEAIVDLSSTHPPKSAMGQAIGYAINNWTALNQFIENPALPLDNNASERALRIIALGRKNYLFAGNDASAENLAGLYSLMASCELNQINPEQYLADVLLRVHTHSQQALADLLPHRWKMLVGS